METKEKQLAHWENLAHRLEQEKQALANRIDPVFSKPEENLDFQGVEQARN